MGSQNLNIVDVFLKNIEGFTEKNDLIDEKVY